MPQGGTLHLVPDANNAVLEATFNAPGLVEGVIVEGFGKGNSLLEELVPSTRRKVCSPPWSCSATGAWATPTRPQTATCARSCAQT